MAMQEPLDEMCLVASVLCGLMLHARAYKTPKALFLSSILVNYKPYYFGYGLQIEISGSMITCEG